jgi:hypothetical protein
MKKSNRKRAIHSLVREAGSDGTVWRACRTDISL